MKDKENEINEISEEQKGYISIKRRKKIKLKDDLNEVLNRSDQYTCQSDTL